MRIEDSHIQLSSSRRHAEGRTQKDEIKAWTGPRPGSRAESSGAERVKRADHVSVSDEARAHFESMKKRAAETRERQFDMPAGVDHEGFLKKLILEAFIGKKIELVEIARAQDETAQETSQPAHGGEAATEWGMEYKATDVSASFEETTFRTSGTVKTVDGEEVGFTLELIMQRVSVTETTASIKAGNAVDPLMVNFGGRAAELTSTRFAFDLNSDGEAESMPFAGSGSGFLVFDKNRDGKANDGRELFGPSTGDGFAELSALDQDGNSWIDEADAAWRSLYVWTKAIDGTDAMKPLNEVNVGAIHVASSATSLELRSKTNVLEGQLRSTGLFLKNDLTPGTIQQVDLVV